jgi:hypothetical protein
MSPKTLATIQRIYDEVHAALWALLIAGVVYLLTVVLPQLPARQAEAERLQEQQHTAEDRYLCEKWGIPAGGQHHRQCVLDLRQLRDKIALEVTDELSF